eukprot:scaffold304824_cov21-Tisochrysis_lutea.AAC.2
MIVDIRRRPSMSTNRERVNANQAACVFRARFNTCCKQGNSKSNTFIATKLLATNSMHVSKKEFMEKGSDAVEMKGTDTCVCAGLAGSRSPPAFS